MRIAIGGFHIEACTFSPLRSGADEFVVKRDDVLMERYASFIGRFSDVEFVPLLHARAIPGGAIARGFYDELKAEFLERLQAALPLDGVLMDMHGAGNVENMDDAEGDWMAAARSVVGENVWMVASYDLHGNVSRRVFDNLDALTAYRTAPHVDVLETQARAFTLLIDGIHGGKKYEKAYIDIPVALVGEVTSTEWEPGTRLYAGILDQIAAPNVVDASILVGYAWADEPRARATVLAYGHDLSSVKTAARTLADNFWEARTEFRFGVPALDVDACILRAMEATETPVFISDSGDNPTAGGVGDVPFTLSRLVALNVPDAVFASIADPESVARCFDAGIGKTVELEIGGKWDRVNGTPFVTSAEVIRLESIPYRGDPAQINRQAVIQIGGVKALLTERRTPFHYEADFQRLNIEPTAHQIVVVKIGYLEPDLKRMAKTALLALSPGVVNQDIVRLPYERIQRPIYPLDPEMTWHPEP